MHVRNMHQICFSPFFLFVKMVEIWKIRGGKKCIFRVYFTHSGEGKYFPTVLFFFLIARTERNFTHIFDFYFVRIFCPVHLLQLPSPCDHCCLYVYNNLHKNKSIFTHEICTEYVYFFFCCCWSKCRKRGNEYQGKKNAYSVYFTRFGVGKYFVNTQVH